MQLEAITDIEKEFLKIFESGDVERASKSNDYLKGEKNWRSYDIYAGCTSREQALVNMIPEIDNEEFLVQVFLRSVSSEYGFTDFQEILLRSIKSSDNINTIISNCNFRGKCSYELLEVITGSYSDEEKTKLLNNFISKFGEDDPVEKMGFIVAWRLLASYSDDFKKEYLVHLRELRQRKEGIFTYDFGQHFPLANKDRTIVSEEELLETFSDKEFAKKIAFEDYSKASIFYSFIYAGYRNSLNLSDEEIFECFKAYYDSIIESIYKHVDAEIERLQISNPNNSETAEIDRENLRNRLIQERFQYYDSYVMFCDTGSVAANKKIALYLISKAQLVDLKKPNPNFVKLVETTNDEELIYLSVKNLSPKDIRSKKIRQRVIEYQISLPRKDRSDGFKEEWPNLVALQRYQIDYYKKKDYEERSEKTKKINVSDVLEYCGRAGIKLSPGDDAKICKAITMHNLEEWKKRTDEREASQQETIKRNQELSEAREKEQEKYETPEFYQEQQEKQKEVDYWVKQREIIKILQLAKIDYTPQTSLIETMNPEVRDAMRDFYENMETESNLEEETHSMRR